MKIAWRSSGSDDVALRTPGLARPGALVSALSSATWPQPTHEFKRLAVAGRAAGHGPSLGRRVVGIGRKKATVTRRMTAQVALRAGGPLLGERAQALLRRVRHGDVAEILDRV